MHEMLIDTGLLDAKSVIPIGTPIVFAQPPYELTDGQITGKCLDDRAGFVSIVQAMKQLKNVDLHVDVVVCGSVHEETDSLGALGGILPRGAGLRHCGGRQPCQNTGQRFG